VFSASADSITFNSVATGLYIPSIPVTGVGGRGLPCVVEAVEVISSVSSTVSVVTAVMLGGFMAGVDVTDRADWFDCRTLASSSVSPFWGFPSSGGKLSFRGVRIILFLLGPRPSPAKIRRRNIRRSICRALVVGDILYILLLLTQTVKKTANSI
jgi:hypothetical protein